MAFCTGCGTSLGESNRFCGACGTQQFAPAPKGPYESTRPDSHAPNQTHHPATARGIGQMFGIDPRVAFLTVIVDMMLFGVETATVELSTIFVSVPVGIVLAVIAYRAQMKWYGDDRETALIKGLTLGLLTAIPTPLPAILYIPAGIVGLFHNVRRKLLSRA